MMRGLFLKDYSHLEMNMRSRIWQTCSLALLSATLLLGGCAQEAPAPEVPQVEIPFRKDAMLEFVRNGEVLLEIDLEIADTDSAITRGLMQRTALPEMSGMLFVFPNEAPRSFWMSNTPLPLDLLFVNSQGEVVSISKYTSPFSTEPILSEAPAQYVIEVEAGFVDTHGLIESDQVRWERVSGGG